MVKKICFIGFCIFFLILGFEIGRNVNSSSKKETESPINANQLRQNGYKYTSPLLDCEYNQSVGETEYKPSRLKIEGYISEAIKTGEISDAATYYRDLSNGPWFGIHEKDPFSPASLLKIPVMMAYFKQAEENPEILNKKVAYKITPGLLEQHFVPQTTLVEGKQYTIEQLIEQMIIYSDNNSLFILQDNIDNSLIDGVTQDLGIETANANTPEDYMSVKSFASLYRVLYNSSYLSRYYSEKALGILIKTTFNKGIGQSLPKNIALADKFGERELDNGVKQLHDCGIVYYPKHPYLLCIMTRGNNYNNLSETIMEISKIIYQDLDSRFHGK